MSRGSATTFDLLAATSNEAAAAVLIGALDSAHREGRDLALAALLNRRNRTAELNVLGRWNEISLRWKTQIAERAGWLSNAIRLALVNHDPKLYECGCAAAAFIRDYDLIPVLVESALDRSHPSAPRAAAATLELAELLAEELAGPRDYRIRRDPHLQRHHVLPSLERAALALGEDRSQELVAAFLVLCDRENAALKRTLQSPHDRSFAPLANVLATSSQPAVERLLLSYLDDSHAPLGAMQIIARRSDVSFLRHLTRKIGSQPSDTVRGNLRRIDSIPWIGEKLTLIDALRDAEQPGAVQLAVGSAISRLESLAVVQHVLENGQPAGRRAAAEALNQLKEPGTDELVLRVFEDKDPQVRAAGALQLRERKIPGAIQRLIGLLESPHEVERAAARASLIEFSFERFDASFDELAPQARAATGLIVRRVSPDAASRLQPEFDAPVRSRRKRALEMAVTLDIVAQLMEPVCELLKDDDQYLRIEAIRVLANVDDPLARQALRDALLDSAPLVQQAAEAALATWARGDTVSAVATRDTVSVVMPIATAAQAPAASRPPTEPWNPANLASLAPS
jgi:HEAT repeat protein